VGGSRREWEGVVRVVGVVGVVGVGGAVIVVVYSI
jgi:hypothetical protein